MSDSESCQRHDHGANIACIATNQGLVFVDAGLNTDIAARFRAKMEEHFDFLDRTDRGCNLHSV